MSDERILISRDGAVATVTVNRPKVLNALDAETVSALADAFSALKADAGVRVVVLTGAGDRAFIAGADIRELARLTPSPARGLAGRLPAQAACPARPVYWNYGAPGRRTGSFPLR